HGHLDRTARRRAADVVHEYVDPTVGLQARLDHAGDVLRASDVAQMGRYRASRFLHTFDGLAQPFGLAVHREDLRAFLGEAHRGRAAVPPTRPHRARAGDDRYLAVETPRHRLNRSMRRGLSTRSVGRCLSDGATPASRSTSTPSP